VEQEKIAKIELDKEKRAREIRICNAMEPRDIKICIFQIFLAEFFLAKLAFSKFPPSSDFL
jgi:hypothetical protein